jgi:type II secretory pathway pseudopilin PulG
MSQSRGAERGHTLVELLTATFVVALMMTAVALFIGPLLRSQDRTQAKVDTIQAAAMALYRVERDMRNTTSGDIWACTIGASPACSAPATTLTPAAAIAMPTAYQNGTGQFQLVAASGKPYWQGAEVYWVDSAGDLEVAFDRPIGYTAGTTLTQTDAQHAVSDVIAAGGMHLARFVGQLSLAVPGAGFGSKISFQMQARSTVGNASNETVYQTDLETRN